MDISPHIQAKSDQEAMGTEEWRQIPGLPGYEASSLGRIRSWRRGGPTPRVLSASRMSKYGHLCVTVMINKRTCGRLVHRLVLKAFVGPCPKGMECCHIDGDAGNNRVDNLRWGTRAENAADRVRHGTDPRGERNPRSKLTWAKVREIRRLAAGGMSYPLLAEMYGVSRASISHVSNHRTWKEQ